jgi:hypothetical protein
VNYNALGVVPADNSWITSYPSTSTAIQPFPNGDQGL